MQGQSCIVRASPRLVKIPLSTRYCTYTSRLILGNVGTMIVSLFSLRGYPGNMNKTLVSPPIWLATPLVWIFIARYAIPSYVCQIGHRCCNRASPRYNGTNVEV